LLCSAEIVKKLGSSVNVWNHKLLGLGLDKGRWEKVRSVKVFFVANQVHISCLISWSSELNRCGFLLLCQEQNTISKNRSERSVKVRLVKIR
jgi:hypothetical protein